MPVDGFRTITTPERFRVDRLVSTTRHLPGLCQTSPVTSIQGDSRCRMLLVGGFRGGYCRALHGGGRMHRVFVHCVMCESRTPAVAVTWLQRHHRLDLTAAKDQVRATMAWARMGLVGA